MTYGPLRYSMSLLSLASDHGICGTAMTTMLGGITAAQLDDTDISPLSRAVAGLLPEGFGILSAAPKVGKSWLVLSLGLAVAIGTPFLGVPVAQRPGLYLALEDGKRRLQER
jgi:RecA-family ATPase